MKDCTSVTSLIAIWLLLKFKIISLHNFNIRVDLFLPCLIFEKFSSVNYLQHKKILSHCLIKYGFSCHSLYSLSETLMLMNLNLSILLTTCSLSLSHILGKCLSTLLFTHFFLCPASRFSCLSPQIFLFHLDKANKRWLC